jgi:hypothetical protein
MSSSLAIANLPSSHSVSVSAAVFNKKYIKLVLGNEIGIPEIQTLLNQRIYV